MHAYPERPLESARLRLRPPSPDDVGALMALAGEWEVVKYTARMPHPYTQADAEAWIAAAQAPTTGGRMFAIESKERGTLIGAIGFVGEADGAPEVGYWIGRPYRDRGYASEALTAFIDHAFATLGLDRLVARAVLANRASHRVLEKCGFLRGRETVELAPARGVRRPVVWYDLARTAWTRA
jgi:8-oxo-dGTP diphosphatase